MSGVSQSVIIVNKKGLHARASAAFAKLAGTFDSQIQVRYDGLSVDGKNIMDLMMLVAHKGVEIEIEAVGSDADRATPALVQLVADGFGELARDREEGEGLSG